jgi:hypothetical protein
MEAVIWYTKVSQYADLREAQAEVATQDGVHGRQQRLHHVVQHVAEAHGA